MIHPDDLGMEPDGTDSRAPSEADVLGAGGPEPEPDNFEPFMPLDELTVPAFPVETLPPSVGDFVTAEAEATQTPPDLAAVLTLAALATACAGRARVRVREGLSEPLNIFVAVALPPASRKSQVFTDVSAPLSEWERDAAEVARPGVARGLEALEQMREQIKHLRTKAKKGGDPDAEREAGDLAAELAEREATAPTTPRLRTDDCTPESLAGLLERQGGRMAVWSPEGGELFEMMRGRYAGNSRANVGVYLQGHAGDPLSVDRRRGHVHVEAPALTVAAAVQPAVIRGLRDERTFRERGLLARFLWSLPSNTVGRRDWEAPAVPPEIARTYRDSIRALLDRPATSTAVMIQLEPDAYAAWLDFARELEPRLAEEGSLGAVADWAGKLPGLVARISGLLHAAEWADRPAPFAQPIDRTTMERALAIGRYALEHALAAFALMGAEPRTEGALKLWRYVARRALAEITRRELWQGCKGGRFAEVSELAPCIGLLCEHGYLRAIGGNGGAKTETYAVNPKALEHSRRGSGGIGGTSAMDETENGGERGRDTLSLLGRNAPNAPNGQDVGHG